MPARRKRSKQTKDHDSNVKLDAYKIVDETTKRYGQHATGTSTPPSISSERSSPSSFTTTDERRDAAETPASSVCTDMSDKLDPRLHDE
ncbi:hypothetical protein ABVK25_006450 [Lepraria finkii]|uniref:Uncharacterized protein n=1 Tax=Lepraria finkii TaxID=1340010 RepID=A0ABR4B5J4_9LECA